MEKKYYTATTWAPWLLIGFILSSFIFAYIETLWLIALLIFIAFLPALALRLAIKDYCTFENNAVIFCRDAKATRFTKRVIPIPDIRNVRQAGRAVQIIYGNGEVFSVVIEEADEFMRMLKRYNANIQD
jgi:hypothetical protein